jgi:hypothetical protein
MEFINSSLGIPVKGNFNDTVPYVNFLGANQKPTARDRREAEAWVMSNYGNDLLKATSLESIDLLIGNIADQKIGLEMALGKRKSGVGQIISFGRQYKKSGNKAGICSDDKCRRVSKARLDALNSFEAKNRTNIEARRKKLETQENTPPPVSSGSNQGSTPPPVGAQAKATVQNSGLQEGVQSGVGEAVSKTVQAAENIGKKDVNVAGKKVPVKTIFMVVAGIGVVWYIVKKIS